MSELAWAAGAFFAAATIVHLLSAALALQHVRRRPNARQPIDAAVTVIRPVCGLDHFDELTLRSTFALTHPRVELIFCCARETDPAAALVRSLIAAHASVDARLLIGDDRPTANPKLNNIAKGWKAARGDWIVIADSNVLMPPDYVEQLLSAWQPGIGLVCSPPLASRPIGVWAELECAFLNTYQARWQHAADALGIGFAQGKTMLWRRAELDAQGGILALGIEIAEDAAATKIVRENGKRVKLAHRPFEQPLGPRRARCVWDRQVRWARLRRATFPLCYAPEVLTGAALPLLAAATAANLLELDASLALLCAAGVWYGTEAGLAWAAGWHLSPLSPLAWVLRDLMIPVLWVEGMVGDGFTWRGNNMTVANALGDERCANGGAN